MFCILPNVHLKDVFIPDWGWSFTDRAPHRFVCGGYLRGFSGADNIRIIIDLFELGGRPAAIKKNRRVPHPCVRADYHHVCCFDRLLRTWAWNLKGKALKRVRGRYVLDTISRRSTRFTITGIRWHALHIYIYLYIYTCIEVYIYLYLYAS